jgi:ferritin
VSILDNEVKLAEATDVKGKVENTMTIAEQTLELSRQILEQIKRLVDTDRKRFPSIEEIYGN